MGKALLVSGLFLSLWVTSCGGGGGSGSSGGGSSGGSNLPPHLVSFSPFRATAGGADFELTVAGSNFGAGSRVMWNNSSRSTTFVDSGHLRVSIPASDIASPGIARIAVSNAPDGGDSAKLRFGIFPNTSGPTFLLYASTGRNTVSGYSADRSTGVLTDLPGSPFVSTPLLTNSESLIIDGLGTYLFVLNQVNSGCKECQSTSEFSIDSMGSLAPISGSPFPGSLFPTIPDLSGNVIYTRGVDAGNNGTLEARLIDANSGSLTLLATHSAPPNTLYDPLAMHPSNSFIYGDFLSFGISSGIWAGSISPTTGEVSVVAGSPFGGMALNQVAIDSSGKYAFATYFIDGFTPGETLVTFAIDPTTGALSVVNSAAFPSPNQISRVFAHPSREFLYIAGWNNNSILAYSIAADGSLTPIAGSPFSTVGLNPSSMVTDDTGKFLYVAQPFEGIIGAGTISGFMIDQTTGALTPIAGSPLVVSAPMALAVAK
jgi:6-phosphogluconolactonase